MRVAPRSARRFRLALGSDTDATDEAAPLLAGEPWDGRGARGNGDRTPVGAALQAETMTVQRTCAAMTSGDNLASS